MYIVLQISFLLFFAYNNALRDNLPSNKQTFIIGLGSNQGDRLENLRQAIKELKKDSDVSLLAYSRIYKTKALLLANSPRSWDIPYFNAAIKIKTTISPEELLTKLQEIEIKLGRPKDHDKWAPRIIDLDILAQDQNILKSESLTIPHLHLLERSFALIPLLDVDGQWHHPEYPDKNIRDLLNTLEAIEILPYSLEGSKLMGVINLTPVSMSGPEESRSPESLKEEIIKMVNDGAEIIDIGAESTRPNAEPITEKEEWERLQLFLSNINSILTNPHLVIRPKISIDTYHAETVEKLKDFDIDIINDVSGQDIEKIAPKLKGTNKKYVLMHNMGKAGVVRMDSSNEQVVDVMISWFKEHIDKLITLGLNKDQIIIDPGIGFGKTKSQTLAIIKNIEQFKQLGFPILVGHSRKGSALPAMAHLPPKDRDLETAFLSKYFSKVGINFIRVHNPLLNRRIIDEKISLIVAHQLDNGIGHKGKLPWNLAEDKKHFRNVTLNKTIIMGRNTWESIGRPLKDRRNIVLSKTLAPTIKGIEVYPSLQEALSHITLSEDAFIIGGEELYNQTIRYADYLHRTIVQASKPADTFFPEIDDSEWLLLSSQDIVKDEKNEYPYRIQKLERLKFPNMYN